MTRTLGVGLLGAGPVTQAIHLPTLARLGDRFHVAAVMDVDEAVASTVATQAGVRATTSMEDLLADPGVEVVAICSPPQFHAAQVEACCAAGKLGILCEKPLANSHEEAVAIASAVDRAGVPVVVGAMHAYDPGWLAVAAAVGDRAREATAVRSTVVLPFNDRFEDWATQISSRPAPPAAGAGPLSVEARADRIRGMVMGLTVHDLPLIRAFAPELDRVAYAEFVAPFGGSISLRAQGIPVDLVAFMRPLWRPDWRLEAWAPQWSLRVDFTPSYVHAGSAAAVLVDGAGEHRFGPCGHNGYEGEWLELHALVTESRAPHHPLATVIADLEMTTGIADAAAALVRSDAA